MNRIDSTAPQTVEELETLLSEPTPGVIQTMQRLPGDIVVLGVGGKMGPTLARMAVRAAEAAGTPRRVIGVSRFSSPAMRNAWPRGELTPFRATCFRKTRYNVCPRLRW